jgi:hypothetical protein
MLQQSRFELWNLEAFSREFLPWAQKLSTKVR